MSESIESSRFVSHRARMLGEFDSRKDSQSTEFERRPQIFVKVSFRKLCGSQLSGKKDDFLKTFSVIVQDIMLTLGYVS